MITTNEKELISSLLENNTPAKMKMILKKSHKSIYEKIDSLETEGGFTEKLYMYLNGFIKLPKCKQCSENTLTFISWKNGFREFCSVSCQKKFTSKQIPQSVKDYNKIHNTKLTNVSQLPSVIKKRNKTMIDKFGTIMPMNNHKETIDKKEATSMKRYGVKNAAHAEITRKKAQQTMLNKTDTEKKVIQNKLQSTCKERYGVSNPMQDKEIYDKAKQTRLERYGVEHCLQNSELARETNIKARKTMQEKYGSPNQLDVPGAKEKFKITSLENFGAEHPMKNKELQEKQYNSAQSTLKEKYNVTNWIQVPGAIEKSKKTCLKKYGVEFSAQNKEIIEKRQQTMLEKFGVKHSILIPGNLEIIQRSHYSRKEYIWKTGEISIVQGYEPIVLKELEEQGYKFNEVLTSPKDMPKIMYQLDENEHRYFPDIFIPKENIIIEVKSNYTLNKEWDKNQAKFEATKSQGFDFRLEVR